MNSSTITATKPTAFNDAWVRQGIDADCLKFLEGFGYYLVDKKSPQDDRPGRNAMTTNQLRNIFSEAKQIEAKVKAEKAKHNSVEWNGNLLSKIHLLRPKIAYAAAKAMDRNKDSKVKDFREVADRSLIVATERMDYYLNFMNIFEAIIAYHKMYGGRDK